MIEQLKKPMEYEYEYEYEEYEPTEYRPIDYTPPEYKPTNYEPEKPSYYPSGYDKDNIDLPNGEIKGYFVAYARDYDRDPNRVLERKLPWYICCEWAISGKAVPAFGGTWHLRVVAEDIGPDKNLPQDGLELLHLHVDVNSVEPGMKREYKVNATIPHNKIPEDGAYKVVVLLTHTNKGPSGKEFRTRLAGFVEIPMLEFYSFDK
jgi:hypothetical protein